jgi:hypothetical protein
MVLDHVNAEPASDILFLMPRAADGRHDPLLGYAWLLGEGCVGAAWPDLGATLGGIWFVRRTSPPRLHTDGCRSLGRGVARFAIEKFPLLWAYGRRVARHCPDNRTGGMLFRRGEVKRRLVNLVGSMLTVRTLGCNFQKVACIVMTLGNAGYRKRRRMPIVPADRLVLATPTLAD